MGIEFVFLGIALACVALTRGSYKQLLATRFSHWWTLVAAVVGQLVLVFAPIPKSHYDSTGLAVLLATYVLLFGFCVANINVKGMWIVLTGIASNAVVIGLNKGMPVTSSGDYVVQESIKHQQESSADLMPWLGDIFPINALSIAISIGDIILGIGLIAVCFFASRKPKAAEEILGMQEMIETDFEIADVAPARSAYADELDVVVDLTRDMNVEESEQPESEPAMVAMPAMAAMAEMPASEPDMESAPVMVASSRGPGARKSDEERRAKAEKIMHSRRHKRWQKKHGLAALPTKEDLGYDEESMEVVDVAH